MKIFMLLLVLVTPLTLSAQDDNALGHTFSEVLNYNKATTGVKIPQIKHLDDGSTIIFYDCTNDDGIGKLFFSYTFDKNNICIRLCIAFKGKFEGVVRKVLNDKYQYADNNTWIDNTKSEQITVEDDQDSMKGYDIYYTKL